MIIAKGPDLMDLIGGKPAGPSTAPGPAKVAAPAKPVEGAKPAPAAKPGMRPVGVAQKAAPASSKSLKDFPGLDGDLTNDPISEALRDRVLTAGAISEQVKEADVKKNKIQIPKLFKLPLKPGKDLVEMVSASGPSTKEESKVAPAKPVAGAKPVASKPVAGAKPVPAAKPAPATKPTVGAKPVPAKPTPAGAAKPKAGQASV